MPDEKWQKVRDIFASALRQQPDERRRFVSAACGEDKTLLAEVESLLSSYDGAESFMETPAIAKVADVIEAKAKLGTGKCFGHYEIIKQIGAGGMGEVYLAKDKKLDRKVAVKILNEEFSRHEANLARFIREAKAVSSLNHPNILVVHEIGEYENTNYIVSEFIEGKTLREILKEKPLKLSEVLEISIPIADALCTAHASNIIHRDIKPENIMVRPDGVVKVLDFGLAKLVLQKDRSIFDSEESTVQLSHTAKDVILGTVSYMSPEQARGQRVDARTDIFSFGILLYEMLTGQQPFTGETASHTIVAILEKDPPPLSQFINSYPPEIERIIKKCLAKKADDRYRAATSLLDDLKELKNELAFQSKLERNSAPNNKAEAETQIIRAATNANSEKRNSIAVLPFTNISAEAKNEYFQITGDQTANRTTYADKRITVDSTQEKSGSRRIVAIVTAAALLASIAVWVVWHRRNLSWARRQVPQIEALSSDGDYFAAYDLASEVQKYLTNDPTIIRLMPTISDMLTVTSEPSGAQVYLKRFSADVTKSLPPRQLVGTTPIRDLRIARGQYLLYVEKDGFAKTVQTISGALIRGGGAIHAPPPLTIEQKLIAADKVPNGMRLVTGGDYRLVAGARPTDARVHLNDFLIDQYEVSNQDYKEFINAGGYLKTQYWTHPFIKDGKTLKWEEATQEFKDRTGLPGPRSWSSQNFPQGSGKYPVTDISWYEAAAYAAFRGKQLPTIFQWEKAARNGRIVAPTTYMPWGPFYPGDAVGPRANFEGDATMPVDCCEFGMSPFGAYNMAGNVSEWCLNETTEGFISTGGAWGEPVYTFARYGTFPGFYTSNKRGFRCAMNLGGTGNDGNLRIEINKEIPVYSRSSSQDFARWVKAYDYVKSPLDPQLQKSETDEWTLERITFNGADAERAIGYLYLPRNSPRPLQVVHYLAGSDVEAGQRSVTQAAESFISTEIKFGRAVFVVVLKGYIERLPPPGFVEPDRSTAEYRDKIVNWVTDLRRGLDYLETRSDIDSKKIALVGLSAGAARGIILAAVDRRYTSVFLAGGGLRKTSPRYISEADIVNFAPHTNGPILMLQGRYDEVFAWKTEGEPLYNLLSEPKRLVLFDGGHGPSLELFATTIHGWLDETLGPVKKE